MRHHLASIAAALATHICFFPLASLAEEIDGVGAPGIASQVRPNWNVGYANSSPDCLNETVTIRVALLPDGTITKIEPVHDHAEGPCFKTAYESVRRALLMTHRLQLPQGKVYDAIIFKFRPGDDN